ncbi:hypothetical protein [Streptomyces sp. NPDC003697]
MSEPAHQGRPARTKLLRRIWRAFARMRPVATVLRVVYYALRVMDELTD